MSDEERGIERRDVGSSSSSYGTIESGSGGGRPSNGGLHHRTNVTREVTFEEPTGDEESTEADPIEKRHEQLNSMFGIKPWKHHVAKRPLEERSETVRRLHQDPTRPPTNLIPSETLINVGNIIWWLFFGTWLAATYYVIGFIMLLTCVGKEYKTLCWHLASYYLWPFGKFLVSDRTEQQLTTSTFEGEGEQISLISVKPSNLNSSQEDLSSNLSHRRSRLSFWVWIVFGAIPLTIAHCIVFSICWLVVVLIPMAKVNREAIRVLYYRPLESNLRVTTRFSGSNVVLCTYQAVNVSYYKYSVDGMNVVLVNLLSVVLLTLLVGYIIPKDLRPGSVFIFGASLISIIPLSYYIGTAVSSLSAQSNFALGAFLNASFGSIVELILYCSAIMEGDLEELVQASIVGSLLQALLLMPGLSMIAAGWKYKEQRFSPVAAGCNLSS